MSRENEFIWLYVPCGSGEEAMQIADKLVAEELVACGNVLEGMTSVFKWKGEVCREREAVLIMKTARANYDRAAERITALHSYECPCVVALPVTAVNEPYAQWLRDNSRGS